MKTIYQQCRSGIDTNSRSFPHETHSHYTKHGRIVVCRGWFPLTSTTTNLIDYFVGKRFTGR
jgi:hypothetical protein